MKRDLLRLSSRSFDLLVVGGGVMGAGIAWDASLRGLSCALVEGGDFASGTSSKTTKLIHGGIRYLENFQWKLVRQSIRERKILLESAPELVKPLPFLIPVAGSAPRPWLLVKIGVTLYDWFAGRASLQRPQFLDRERLTRAEPLLSDSGTEKGALYTDAQMDDARLVLEVVRAAAGTGAVVANHCGVARLNLEAGKVTGAELEDRLTGKRFLIRAAVVVNATGPWVDRLRRLADPAAKPVVRPSKGIHLVYPGMGLKQALLLSSSKDRRIFFLIPWRGLTLIGTTDTDYEGDPGDAVARKEDVDYLIEETNRRLPKLNLRKDQILSTFAGVRPLVLQEKKDPWAVSRSHLIHEDSNGLISLVGGKFTTFRYAAQELVDRIAGRFSGRSLAPCRTDQTPLGAEARADREPARPLCPHHPFTLPDIRYAVQEEMAMTISDLLWRRFQVGHSPCHGLDLLAAAGEEMSRLLGWSSVELSRQLAAYQAELSLNNNWRS